MKTSTILLTLTLVVCGGGSAVAQLEFLFEPASQSASVGADAFFLGTAYGFEPPEYQWRKDGVPLAGQNQEFLYLANLQPGDAGGYDVVAWSGFGAITSQVATLTVDGTFTQVLADPLVNEPGNSTGSAWGDFDNDGSLDVFVTRGGTDFNSLFRNRGDGTFTKLNVSPVTTDLGASTGAAWADYDNDGWLDLLVANAGTSGTNFLYRNNGDGTFSRVASGVGLDVGNAQTLAWADYDRDGWVDVIVAPIGGGGFFGPQTGGLYRNDNGLLTRVTNNVPAGLNQAQSATWADYDGDGDSDLFCATTPGGGFFGGNGNEVLYRNDGLSGFVRVEDAPIATSGNASSTASWADYDGDGYLDVFVGNADGQVKFLFRNNGDGTFLQVLGAVAEEEGAVESSAWGDYDNDGWIDLFVANNMGHNFLFKNNGDGTFSRVDAGSPTGDPANSVSAAWVDVNNDGFLDLFVTRLGDNNALYRNHGNSNAWLSVRFAPYRSNRSAIGAQVRILATIGGVERWQYREIASRDSSGSPGSLRAEFGLGDATNITTLRVDWPSGEATEWHDLSPRQILTVREPPTLSIQGAEVVEGDAGVRYLNFLVRLQEPVTNIVSVDFTTVDASAIAGLDYVATNGTLYFAPGETNLTVAVAVLGDTADQGDRLLVVSLSNAVNLPILTAQAVGRIIDDDPLTLSVDNATVAEGHLATTNLIFTVSLNKPWPEPVSFDFATGNFTALSGQDYLATNGSLMIQPGEVALQVAVVVLGDLLNELDESMVLNVRNVVGAALTRSRGGGTILNDDPLPVISVAAAGRVEGQSSTNPVVFSARLSAPSSRPVSFSFASVDGTAVAPADYRSQSGTISFPAGASGTNLVVVINGDLLPEGNEVFFLALTNAVNAVLAAPRADGLILDDDFMATGPVISGADVAVRFLSVSNRQHRIEWTTELTPPVSWAPVPGAESVVGTGGLLEVIDSGAATVPRRFYRIRLLP